MQYEVLSKEMMLFVTQTLSLCKKKELSGSCVLNPLMSTLHPLMLLFSKDSLKMK